MIKNQQNRTKDIVNNSYIITKYIYNEKNWKNIID